MIVLNLQWLVSMKLANISNSLLGLEISSKILASFELFIIYLAIKLFENKKNALRRQPSNQVNSEIGTNQFSLNNWDPISKNLAEQMSMPSSHMISTHILLPSVYLLLYSRSSNHPKAYRVNLPYHILAS